MKIDKEKIKKQAKEIMDNFVKALSEVGEEPRDFFLRRKRFLREKTERYFEGKELREISFKNAPKKKGDFFLAEKKSW